MSSVYLQTRPMQPAKCVAGIPFSALSRSWKGRNLKASSPGAKRVSRVCTSRPIQPGPTWQFHGAEGTRLEITSQLNFSAFEMAHQRKIWSSARGFRLRLAWKLLLHTFAKMQSSFKREHGHEWQFSEPFANTKIAKLPNAFPIRLIDSGGQVSSFAVVHQNAKPSDMIETHSKAQETRNILQCVFDNTIHWRKNLAKW